MYKVSMVSLGCPKNQVDAEMMLFSLKEADVKTTFAVLERFLSTYQEIPTLDVHSFAAWVAIRHFQLQATILEIHGINCIKNSFIDAQLQWLLSWIDATGLNL